MSSEHFDVLIVGAGISGVGAAYHLQKRFPDKSYALLEGRERMGGTWDLFRYPGIRSDSDMYTLGYPFRPWRGDKAITEGHTIREYIEDTAREFGIDRHIRFSHKVEAAEWSSKDALWTLTVRGPEGATARMTCRFLLSCCGYYDYEQGYMPDFPGAGDFGGELLHPQHWPENYDVSGKRVVVIGSGATAVTLVPALVEEGAGHVTLLQRSPTYVASRPARDPLARIVNRWLPPSIGHQILRAKSVLLGIWIYQLSRRKPETVKRKLAEYAEGKLGGKVAVDPHFTPSYDPWDQRLCLVPDDDLFEVLREGQASIVTGHIDRFTENGIALQSGERLEADVIVSATGLNLKPLGGMNVAIDGEALDPGTTYNYKGMMFSGVPNFAAMFGYTNASWTLKTDLASRYVCRLIKETDKRGAGWCVPRLGGDAPEPQPLVDFSAGYIQRGIHMFPRQGTERPWRNHDDYLRDLADVTFARLDDGAMRFEGDAPAAPANERIAS